MAAVVWGFAVGVIGAPAIGRCVINPDPFASDTLVSFHTTAVVVDDAGAYFDDMDAAPFLAPIAAGDTLEVRFTAGPIDPATFTVTAPPVAEPATVTFLARPTGGPASGYTGNVSLSWVRGQGVGPVQWVTTADVAAALGLAPASANGDAWLIQVTAAANDFGFRRRSEAGYVDNRGYAPTASAFTGVVLYAQSLYRQRGAVDSYASFDELGAAAMASGGTWGTVKTLLGVDRPQVG